LDLHGYLSEISYAQTRGQSNLCPFVGAAFRIALSDRDSNRCKRIAISFLGDDCHQIIGFDIGERNLLSRLCNFCRAVQGNCGLGLLVIQSIQFADVPLLAAYLVMIALGFAVLNLCVDLLYAAIDPRVRSGMLSRAG